MRKPANPFSKAPSPKEMPASRRLDFEGTLCAAIKDRLAVKFKYRDDAVARTLEPHAVYYSETSLQKVMVSVTQVSNPNDPLEKLGPRDFEIGRMSDLHVTGVKFTPDPRFDRNARKYANGIICSV